MSVLLKRIILTIVSISLIFILIAYFFIPSTFTIYNTATIVCNTAAASRTVNTNWKHIFYRHSDTTFYMYAYSYQIDPPVYNGSRINIKKGDKVYKTALSWIPVSSDTSILHWTVTVATGSNPVQKVFSYFEMSALRANMLKVTDRLQLFLQTTSNVYQYNITRTTLTDTVLMFTKKSSKVYPTLNDIYTLVEKVKKYIAAQGAIETNSPMLNIIKSDSGYTTMVGIPTNKELPADNDIIPRYLRPIKDKILTTEVHGGPASITNAYKQIEQYMRDRSLSPPVIPFELMITDRSKQTDTTKWVTRIFYPII